MLVDRRKDNYDELLVLARDARASRGRTSRWTTAIVTAAVGASAVYVGAMNSQVDQLRQAKDAADAEAFRLNVDLARLQDQHVAVLAERDVYKKNAEWFVTLTPGLEASNRLGDIANALRPRAAVRPGPEDPPPGGEQPAPNFALSNLVWYVDGSRRFPMATNDILWIPEGRFWVRLEENETVSIHTGSRPPDADDQTPGYDLLPDGAFYERAANRGNANCVRIELGDRTQRSEFGPQYVDMIVTWRNTESCADRYVNPNRVPPTDGQ